MTAPKRRKQKYTGDDAHTQPYDHEGGVFDSDNADPDYDERDLAGLPERDEPDPLATVTESAEIGTDADDGDDRVAETGGKARRLPLTRQLVQDAGGYSTEVDPRMLWKTATRFYCRSCGEGIRPPFKRLKCAVPADPCTPAMLKNRGGCQSCREQYALDQREARGTGNPPQVCRPAPGVKESRCAKDWRNTMARWVRAVKTAEKRGTEPPPGPEPAEPKWTARDLRKLQDAQDIATIRAEYELRRPLPSARQPMGIWDQETRGTGFDSRDKLRKPGWR